MAQVFEVQKRVVDGVQVDVVVWKEPHFGQYRASVPGWGAGSVSKDMAIRDALAMWRHNGKPVGAGLGVPVGWVQVESV